MDQLDNPLLGATKERHRNDNTWLQLGVVEVFYHLPQFVLLALLAFETSKNYLWVILNFFFVFLDFMVSWTYFMRLGRHGVGDLNFIDLIPGLQIGSYFCNRRAVKGLWAWLLWQNVFWAFLVILWIRPAFLYMDAFGGTFLGASSLARGSSCSKVTFYEQSNTCIQNNEGTEIVYHPEGKFSINNAFRHDGIYANCFLEQRWAAPTFSGIWIGGFGVDSNGVNICDEPLNGGTVSRYNCPNAQEVCLQGYPGLWYGLRAQRVSSLQVPNTTGNLATFCPGNTGGLTNISSTGERVLGKPLPVCSFCLWYNIYNGLQVADEVLTTCLPGWNRATTYPPSAWGGWKSYQDGTTDPSWGCGLCPGRGTGAWGFREEIYSNNGIETSYWLYTTVAMFLPAWRKLLYGVILFVQGFGHCFTRKHLFKHHNGKTTRGD